MNELEVENRYLIELLRNMVGSKVYTPRQKLAVLADVVDFATLSMIALAPLPAAQSMNDLIKKLFPKETP